MAACRSHVGVQVKPTEPCGDVAPSQFRRGVVGMRLGRGSAAASSRVPAPPAATSSRIVQAREADSSCSNSGPAEPLVRGSHDLERRLNDLGTDAVPGQPRSPRPCSLEPPQIRWRPRGASRRGAAFSSRRMLRNVAATGPRPLGVPMACWMTMNRPSSKRRPPGASHPIRAAASLRPRHRPVARRGRYDGGRGRCADDGCLAARASDTGRRRSLAHDHTWRPGPPPHCANRRVLPDEVAALDEHVWRSEAMPRLRS
jgi:hypothetical protein